MKTLLLSLCVFFSMQAVYAQAPVLVADISPGHASPFGLTEWNNKLYFFANDLRNGIQIWYYDGQSQPQMVPNPAGVQMKGISEMVVYNNKLYFSGGTYATGFELCSYDGVNPPKVEVDLLPGTRDGSPWNFCVFNGRLFFCGGTVANGRELLSYDGVNPPKIYDVFIGTSSSNPGNLIGFNGKLYFSPSLCQLTGLWVLDPVKDSVSALPGVGIESFGYIITGGNSLYFTGNSGNTPDLLYRYTSSDSLIPLTSPALNSIQKVGKTPTVVFNNAVYFLGIVTNNTVGFFKYNLADGTIRKITSFFYDPQSGAEPGYELLNLTTFNSSLYFTAIIDTAIGYELYRYDGSALNLVADLIPGNRSGRPDNFKVFNDNLYMSADNGSTGVELYRLGKTTGIQADSWNGDVRLYPNPAAISATLSITLPGSQSLRVALTDISGREVFSSGTQLFTSGRRDVTLPLQRLASGQYFYRILSSEGSLLASGRVLKQ